MTDISDASAGPGGGHEFLTFYSLIPDAPAPKAADPEIHGSIPLRAHRVCEPFTAACGFGWWIYPPFDFDIMWDGHDILSRVPDGADWQALGEVFVPRFVEAFERRAPTEHQRFSRIPVLARGPEHGIFQIWTGLLIRTRPDWSILVRQLANYPRHSGYEALEGLIETDWWFGPVICLLRMTKTDRVVEFRTARPIIQIQPVYRPAYTKQFTTWRVVTGVESLSTDDWGRLADTLSLRNNEKEAIGSYKRTVRTRQRQRAHLGDTAHLDDG